LPLLQARLDRLRRLRELKTEEARKAQPPRPDPNRFATPGDLARAINPATIQTTALDLVDEAVVWAHTTRGARLIVSMPPQEGKSERVTKTGSLWALTRNPDTRIGIVSYAQPLAEGFGRDIRNWVSSNNGDEGTFNIGLTIAADNGSAKRWQLAGFRGGIVCVGIGGGLTGKPLDALVIDDPIADEKQASSAAYRDRVWAWWQAVGSTRLAPGAPVICILTRWHEDDIAGRFLAAEDAARWRVVNIPAQADYDPNKGESDPLGRQPGEWLASRESAPSTNGSRSAFRPAPGSSLAFTRADHPRRRATCGSAPGGADTSPPCGHSTRASPTRTGSSTATKCSCPGT
jgi:hypothetical protein